MEFFKDFSIRGKIVSVLLVVVLIELLVSLSGLYFLNSVNRRLKSVVDIDTKKMDLVWRVNTDLLEIHRAQKNLIMSLTKDYYDQYKGHLTHFRREMEENLAELDRMTEGEERVLLGQFKDRYDAFLKVDNRIESLLSSDWEALYSAMGEHAARRPENLDAKAIELSVSDAKTTYNSASKTLMELLRKTSDSVEQSKALSERSVRTSLLIMLLLSSFGLASGLLFGLLVSRSIASRLSGMVGVAEAIARGDLETAIEVQSQDETGRLAFSIIKMQSALRRARDEASQRDWLKSGIARLNDAMRGRVDVSDLCRQVISEVASYLNARVGAFFLLDGSGFESCFTLTGGYARSHDGAVPDRFKLGQGLVGEVAREGKPVFLKDIPEDYVKVISGLGDSRPRAISLSPLVFEGKTTGVIELGFLKNPTELELEYLQQVMPAIAINVETVQGREELARALARSQTLTEELQVQQEELRAGNEALEEQARLLEQSREKLRAQQLELEHANQELEEKNKSLQMQQRDIEEANRELERTKDEVEEKANQLEIAGRYKSEFLANMSHELRTPLNSLLLLARMLADNKQGNLSQEQVRSAEIIYSSGNDLLSLINEILDLSKIEAGRMETEIGPVEIEDLARSIRAGFVHLAEEKGLRFEVEIDPDCPAGIETDRKRLEQIIRNLVSNALKFTERGSIEVGFSRVPDGILLPLSGLDPKEALAVRVSDTGIGIPASKQEYVFEAFQQLSGGSARKYGGTGLGLSISRELAKLLGGGIKLESEEGKGSTFTLFIPTSAPKEKKASFESPAPVRSPEKTPPNLKDAAASAFSQSALDDRTGLGDADTVILIVEDDPGFAALLQDLCHEKGYKTLISATGEEGLESAHKYMPSAVMLDIRLPSMNGWRVLEAFKENSKLRHIPVHLMSVDEESLETIRKSAVGYLQKPATKAELEAALARLEEVFGRPVRNLLVVEDDPLLRQSIVDLIGGEDVKVDQAETGADTIHALDSGRYDCMILDLGLPDMDGLELLKLLEANEKIVLPPVIIYTGRELTHGEQSELRKHCGSVIIKGAGSESRLLDEASLFLHRVFDRMDEKKKRIIADLHDPDSMFRGRKVLIVDDDMRNVFALSSLLEERGIRTVKAENGLRALEILESEGNIDLVLMDIMMPEMDGYEAMRRIRADEKFQRLPIIALTAKAMKEDKELCMSAGASDYLAKPVDLKRLLSMMRVWMY